MLVPFKRGGLACHSFRSFYQGYCVVNGFFWFKKEGCSCIPQHRTSHYKALSEVQKYLAVQEPRTEGLYSNSLLSAVPVLDSVPVHNGLSELVIPCLVVLRHSHALVEGSGRNMAAFKTLSLLQNADSSDWVLLCPFCIGLILQYDGAGLTV